MTYPYKYTWRANPQAAGYSGPVPLENSMYSFEASVQEQSSVSELLRASIIKILTTTPGERVMRPEFGCRLKNFLFEPNDDVIIGDIQTLLVAGLVNQDPRIGIKNVSVSANREQHEIVVEIQYENKSTGTLELVSILLAKNNME